MLSGSKLTNLMSTEILKLVETGKMQELKSRWWVPSDSESCIDKSLGSCDGMAPLELEHLGNLRAFSRNFS
jgi:hypothetical protein